MACCSLKCLQCMVFTVALVIMVAVGVGPIVFGILFRNEKLVEALDMQTAFLASTISVGAVVILFSFCGLCGACKSNKKSARYCLCWYFIFLIIVIVLVVGMLIFFIVINKNGEDNLKKFCDVGREPYTGIFWEKLEYLKDYDNEIKAIGQTNRFCSNACQCKVPATFTASTAQWRNSHETLTAATAPPLETNTSTLQTDATNGKTSISDCSAYYDPLGKFVKAIIVLMGEVEDSFNCSGVCIAANLSIGKDSTNRNILANYNNYEGSCFNKVIDYMKERWVPGIGLFSGLLAILFFSIVFVCCICYHDDLKE